MGILDRLGVGPKRAAEPYRYPLERTNERTLAPDFSGRVFVWDIDKTYLASNFESFKGLLSIPFEFAIDKRVIAGADVILRALRRGPDPGLEASHPLYFISASPVQMRGVIQRKMTEDGVEYDGICFKDQLAILRSRRVGRIREQIGYKLSGLLLLRRELPDGARQYLFGDDSESDAIIYALYADIAAGRLRGRALVKALEANGVDPQDARYVEELAADLPPAEMVQRIYIHLEKRTPPGRFAAWGASLIPCYDSFQMGLHLSCHGLVARETVYEVGLDLLGRHGHRPLGLLRDAFDALERRLVELDGLRELWPELVRRGLVPPYVALADSAPELPPAPRRRSDFVTPAEYLG